MQCTRCLDITADWVTRPGGCSWICCHPGLWCAITLCEATDPRCGWLWLIRHPNCTTEASASVQSDVTSAIFNAMQSLGEGLGPLIGGGLEASAPNHTTINCDQTDCRTGFAYGAMIFGLLLASYSGFFYVAVWRKIHSEDSDGLEEPTISDNLGMFKSPGQGLSSPTGPVARVGCESEDWSEA